MPIEMITLYWGWARARWELAAHDEAGGVAERMVLIGIFVALALAAGMGIYVAVSGKAKTTIGQINSSNPSSNPIG